MKRLKVMTVLGTRPDIIKLSRVIAELDVMSDHVLVHTGQNFDYTLSEVFFRELGVRRPDYFLDAAGKTYAQTIAHVIERTDGIIVQQKPDALLVLGDTNSSLAVIPAKRRHVPIFHMEAGNRCYDERVPEEINRKIVDHLSDINLPFTEHARRYLLREGVRPETVVKTGSPMKEVLTCFAGAIERSDVLERYCIRPREYVLASAHREENVDSPDRLASLLDALKCVADVYAKPILFSTHPRTRKRLDELARASDTPWIRFLDALGFLDYVKLQKHAFCVLSDSGTLTEESSILGFPAVTPRESHERPEGMDEGTLVMSGLSPERILQAVHIVTQQFAEGHQVFRTVADYEVDNVSKKIVRIIYSYVNYVNRTVWYRL